MKYEKVIIMNSTSSLNVGKLLVDLQSPDAYERRVAAEGLRSVSESSEEIAKALVRAAFSDGNKIVASAARRALDAPVHQAILKRHPEWLPEEPPKPIDPNPEAVEPSTKTTWDWLFHFGDHCVTARVPLHPEFCWVISWIRR